jgi:hypothetical protein
MWRKREIKELMERRDRMIHIDHLTDEELEACVDGITNMDLLREILQKPYCVVDNVVDEEQFAQWFAYALEGFIGVDQDEEPEEWETAYQANYDWGYEIAENINDYVQA